jgi:thiamine biosynthesis lipoprotein
MRERRAHAEKTASVRLARTMSRPIEAGLLLVGLTLQGCRPAPRVQVLSGPTQGTTYHVSAWTPEGVDTAQLEELLEAELARVDALMSNYRSDSVIERFNAARGTEPVEVGREIVSLIRQARQVSEASQGCYDVTIEPVLDLWGFDDEALRPPDDEALRRALATTGFRHLETASEDRLAKALPELRVDLSSIAQGYTVGRVAVLLEQRGIENYLVEIGGELQTRGAKPGGEPWRVGVEQPVPGGRHLQRILVIERTAPLAIATSGTYRRFFDLDGKRYSHVLDARTGRPVAHDTASVTVLHTDPALADAWSTALLCLGRVAGLRAADEAGIAALFVDEASEGLREHGSRAWTELKHGRVTGGATAQAPR